MGTTTPSYGLINNEAGPSYIPTQQNLTPSRLNTPNIDTSHNYNLNTSSLASPNSNQDVSSKIKGYPLLFLPFIDLLYTSKSIPSISIHLIILSSIRIMLLTYVGISKKWKFKKSYIVLITGLTLMVLIWKGCKIILMRSIVLNKDDAEKQRVEIRYLFFSSILAIIEYLSYLILLRLSLPLSHSTTRLPHTHSHTQTPSSIRYKSTTTPGSVRFAKSHKRHVSRGTLRSVRSTRFAEDDSTVSRMLNGERSEVGNANGHATIKESNGEDVFTSSTEVAHNGGTLGRRSLERLHDNGNGYYGNYDQDVDEDHESSYDEYEYEYEYEYEDDDDEDEQDNENHDIYNTRNFNRYDVQQDPIFDENEDDDDSSSISESSIIDLPPPLSPSSIPLPTTIHLPRSTSLNLNLATGLGNQISNSPIFGPIVRRSRSGFLGGGKGGRSWNSTTGWVGSQNPSQGQGQGREGEDGGESAQREDSYGTF